MTVGKSIVTNMCMNMSKYGLSSVSSPFASKLGSHQKSIIARLRFFDIVFQLLASHDPRQFFGGVIGLEVHSTDMSIEVLTILQEDLEKCLLIRERSLMDFVLACHLLGSGKIVLP